VARAPPPPDPHPAVISPPRSTAPSPSPSPSPQASSSKLAAVQRVLPVDPAAHVAPFLPEHRQPLLLPRPGAGAASRAAAVARLVGFLLPGGGGEVRGRDVFPRHGGRSPFPPAWSAALRAGRSASSASGFVGRSASSASIRPICKLHVCKLRVWQLRRSSSSGGRRAPARSRSRDRIAFIFYSRT
jgi:hypothetical protein